nr:unnamed protein product [Brassica rapa]
MTMSGGDGRDSELASLRNRVKELEAENAKLLSQVSSCQCQQHDDVPVLDSGSLVRRSRRGRKRADKSIPIHLISKRYVALKIMYFGKR